MKPATAHTLNVMHNDKKYDMSIKTVYNKNLVLPNFDHSEKYWPILTDLVKNEINDQEISEPGIVQDILKKCFTKLCQVFEEKINQQKKASFFICCQYLHEDSLDLWQLQLKGINLGVNEEYFASSRRTLKIVLEQSTKLDLIGSSNFLIELQQNQNEYIMILEELLYLGHWCIALSEYTARSQMFPKSTGLKIEDGEFTILTYQPYPELFKFIFNDIQKHSSKVALSDSILEFQNLIRDHFKIEYSDLSSFILQQTKQPGYRFSLAKINSLIQKLHEETNGNEDFIENFYSGLTVDKTNCVSIEKSIYNNQDEKRHVFRPILELTVDNKKYNLIGHNKWLESFTTLTTNCFPFGLYPEEWRQFKEIREFIHKIDNTHDKILQKPIIDILNAQKIYYEIDIESFDQGNGTNINIKNSIGDIDILFIDDKTKSIYISECKHNRSRFDMNNWKRDYTNFKSKYEQQLDRKVDWAEKNINVIETHFKTRNVNFKSPLNEYNIKGIFIINAPTIYMYNGKYRAFTIHDISQLLTTGYIDIKLEMISEDKSKKYLIEHPYFDNTERLFL